MNINRFQHRFPLWKRVSLAVTLPILMLSGSIPPLTANTTQEPLHVSQRRADWQSDLRMARLVNVEQRETDLVIQVDLLDKPETTYANAVYQVFARRDGRWEEIYTNVGARLIQNQAGRYTLPPEVIPISDLQERLQERFGDDADLDNFDLKSIVQIRYDAAGGRRDQQLEFEQIQEYRAIAQTTRTELFARREHEGDFSLAILQPQATFQDVIARVSVKSKQDNVFQQEKYIGDYRYRSNQRIQFTQGLNAGDRIVVRLFDQNNRFIGYSEFDCLDDHSSVYLILSDNPNDGIVRTVYGKDVDFNGRIDQSVETYDYFTRVTNVSSYRSTQVTFLETTDSIANINAFNGFGLPAPRRRCTYPTTIERGAHVLAGRRLRVFSSGLASAITSVPGRVVDIVNVDSSSTTVTRVEVSQSISIHRDIGISDWRIVNSCDFYCVDSEDYDDDDDDDDDYAYDDDDDDDDGGFCDDDCDDDDDDDDISRRQTITLSNGFQITFLGVSYRSNTSIWRYYVEELPSAQDLSNWVLGLPSCARVVSASPRGELVNPDPNARISGIKWQPGGGFVQGEFSVTLSGQVRIGQIDVAAKGPDVAWGEIAGPTCNR